MMTITHSPATVAPAAEYSAEADPMFGVDVWELTDRERLIYELGFHTGCAARQPGIDQLDPRPTGSTWPHSTTETVPVGDEGPTACGGDL